MSIYGSITELVGNTPLLRPLRYEKECSLQAKLLLKLECFNPAGSAKDRVAAEMIRQAEEDGLLREGSVIIEPTSGNTGIGLAAMAKVHGYRVILTMPDTMSAERRSLLRAYGAELILTDGARGMAGAIEKANELAAAVPNSFQPGQFTSRANPNAHYKTTGPEIWRDTDGAVDIFVAGVGTGGTLSGTGRYLKEKSASVQIVAVEPENSAVLSGKTAGAHGLQGIGAGFVPDILDTALIDRIIPVSDASAYAASRALVRCEGVMTGITSGAALWAATELAKQRENAAKTIVVLLPDTGGRYLSTPLFSEVDHAE